MICKRQGNDTRSSPFTDMFTSLHTILSTGIKEGPSNRFWGGMGIMQQLQSVAPSLTLSYSRRRKCLTEPGVTAGESSLILEVMLKLSLQLARLSDPLLARCPVTGHAHLQLVVAASVAVSTAGGTSYACDSQHHLPGKEDGAARHRRRAKKFREIGCGLAAFLQKCLT